MGSSVVASGSWQAPCPKLPCTSAPLTGFEYQQFFDDLVYSQSVEGRENVQATAEIVKEGKGCTANYAEYADSKEKTQSATK